MKCVLSSSLFSGSLLPSNPRFELFHNPGAKHVSRRDSFLWRNLSSSLVLTSMQLTHTSCIRGSLKQRCFALYLAHQKGVTHPIMFVPKEVFLSSKQSVYHERFQHGAVPGSIL
ncbi:hypothetical protein AMECASPLE_021024 [Ameca splendens]|uniref:Uncharacterized protein n=1 Tax=Ameca splendens TaxID=208324 RepID=A0ABV0ZC98_9TELE